MAVKRRTIWLSDVTWGMAKRQAEVAGLNISELLGAMLTENVFELQERAKRPEVALAQDIAESVLYAETRPALQPAHIPALMRDPVRDANREYRPAPKPGKGK
jgi:hypothetical protein